MVSTVLDIANFITMIINKVRARFNPNRYELLSNFR